jgi:hypothetical protein
MNHTTVALRAAGANHDSFRSALEWSLDRGEHDAALRLADFLWPYWLFTRPAEGADWLARTLVASSDEVSPVRVDALIGQAMVLQQLGGTDLGQIEGLLENARGMAARTRFVFRAHLAEYFLGELALIRGDPKTADGLLNTALDGFDTARVPIGSAWCHHALGWLALAGGHLAQAEAHFNQTAGLVGRAEWGDERIRIHALAGLAVVAAVGADPTRARSLADEAVTSARLLPFRPTLVMALVRAGEVAALTGDSIGGALRELLDILYDLGRSSWTADAVEMAVLLHEADGRGAVAARLLGASRALRTASGGPVEGNASLSGMLRACRERLAHDLGPVALAEHEIEGEAMSVRDVITLALEGLEKPQV